MMACGNDRRQGTDMKLRLPGGFFRQGFAGCDRGRLPRRHRRGLSALTATLLVSLLLGASFSAWALTEALRLQDAQARALEH